MKDLIIFVVAGLLSIPAAKAQQGFSRTYDYLDYEDSTRCATLALSNIVEDDRILVVGISQNDLPSITMFTYYAAYDFNGSPIWEKRFSPPNPYFKINRPLGFRMMKKVDSNRYVWAGVGFDTTAVSTYTVGRPFLYYFNSNGDSLKLSHWEYEDNMKLYYVEGLAVDANKNVVMGGSYTNYIPAPDTGGLWIAKFSPQGNFLWKTIITGIPYNSGTTINDITEGNNNNYLISGKDGYLNPDTTNYTVWSVGANGNPLWRRAIPKTPDWMQCSFDVAHAIKLIPAMNHSGYYFITIATTAIDTGSCTSIYYCGKLDNYGNMVWAKTYQRSNEYVEMPYSLAQQKNGDLVFIGNSEAISGDRASSGATMFCTDSLGNLKWFKLERWATCMNIQTIDQRFFDVSVNDSGNIARSGGISTQVRMPCYDTMGDAAWLMLTDSTGKRDINDTFFINKNDIIVKDIPIMPTAIEPIPQDKAQLIYPSPATHELHIQHQAKGTLTLYDISGRSVAHYELKDAKSNIDISQLSPGIYMAVLQEEGKAKYYQKIVKR